MDRKFNIWIWTFFDHRIFDFRVMGCWLDIWIPGYLIPDTWGGTRTLWGAHVHGVEPTFMVAWALFLKIWLARPPCMWAPHLVCGFPAMYQVRIRYQVLGINMENEPYYISFWGDMTMNMGGESFFTKTKSTTHKFMIWWSNQPCIEIWNFSYMDKQSHSF